MSRSRPWSDANPDLRRQTQLPAVPIEQIEQRLYQLLSPESFKPIRYAVGKKQQRLRERILTLPVMMAVVLSLVYRRIPSLSELLRVLKVEGLLWIEPISVSKQALCKRLRELPASLFADVFEQVMERMRLSASVQSIPENWQGAAQNFPAIWIADGSTLEELRKKLKGLSECGTVLGGKMMMLVEAFTHNPVATWYEEDAKAYRSNPCKYKVRLVSVLWGKSWYYYLTNVMEPTLLSPQQICELYRIRWRI